MTNNTTEAGSVTNGDTEQEHDTQSVAPFVTVTSGNPTDEEVAAVAVLLAALSSGGDGGEPNLRRGWARPSRSFGRATVPGAGWSRR